jgi:hypothetical protein
MSSTIIALISLDAAGIEVGHNTNFVNPLVP